MTKLITSAYAQKLLDSSAPDLSSVNLKIAALDATHTYSAAHDFLDDITGGSTVATTGNLGTKTITGGVFDAANISLGSPAGGDTITQFYLYYDTTVAGTSLLIAYWNEDAAGAAISIATDGTEITINFHASGLFRV